MSLSVNTNLYSTYNDYNKYNPNFCSNNTCKNYSTQNHPKKLSTTKKVEFITLGTIALTIIGDIIFAKGKHVKSLLNLSKKSSKTNQIDSNIGTKAATKEKEIWETEVFPEFKVNCKYTGCLHIKENGCEVIEKVKNNKILKSRYESYLKLIKEVD